MTTATINMKNPAELHTAGLRALNRELGADGAKAFVEQYFGGYGDYTAEKKTRPPKTEAERNEIMNKIKAEAIEAGTWE